MAVSNQGSSERRVTSSQPMRIRAGEFNAWQDAARRVNALIKTGSEDLLQSQAAYTTYRAKNSTTLDLVRGSIVDFGAVGSALPVEPPSSEFYFGPVMRLQEPRIASTAVGIVVEPMAEQDKFGFVAVSGVHAVQCNVIDTGHKYWDLVPQGGDPTLGEVTHVQSAESGGRGELIWHTGSTGTDDALIRLSVVPSGRFDGVADSGVSEGTCLVDVTVSSVMQAPAPDVGTSVEVVNKFHWLIDTGALVAAEWNANRQQWEAYQVMCPGNTESDCV